MKKTIFILLVMASFASAWWERVDCNWRYENGVSGYFGLYRNSQGGYIQMFFGNTYCPVNIN